MTTSLIKKKTNGNSENLPAVRQDLDGFRKIARGNGGAGIIGTILKFVKGSWFAGTSNNEQPVPLGTAFAVELNTAQWGWVRWENGELTETQIDYCASGIEPPRRNRIGENDEASWPETNDDGSPKDPWRRDARVYMVRVEDGEEFTFASSSWGGQMAFRELIKAYLDSAEDHPGELPIVALGSYMRSDKRFGRIATPVFELIGWATLADVTNGTAFDAMAAEEAEDKPKRLKSKKVEVVEEEEEEEDEEDSKPFSRSKLFRAKSKARIPARSPRKTDDDDPDLWTPND